MAGNELAEIALTSGRPVPVAQHSSTAISGSHASSKPLFFLTPLGLLLRKLFAEFIGVMLFVILIGYVVNAVGNPSVRPANIIESQSFSAALICYSLVNGLGIAVLMGMLAHISGGYFNPALVIGCYAVGSFDGSMLHALLYILAQLAGSVVGASWLLLLPAPTTVKASHLHF
jgi:glycerol uptake facilitator-like aquaporin